jgi:hypothetical protein
MAGSHASEAVTAFRLRPSVGLGRLFGLRPSEVAIPSRLIARTYHGFELWSAYTGPTPNEIVGSYEASAFRVVAIEARATGRNLFDQVDIGGTTLWTHSTYRDMITGWSTPPES